MYYNEWGDLNKRCRKQIYPTGKMITFLNMSCRNVRNLVDTGVIYVGFLNDKC